MTSRGEVDGIERTDARRSDGVALRHAIRHFQVSTGIEMDAVAITEAFATGIASGDVLDAAEAHLREADPAEIADFIVEGSATIPGLRRLAEAALPEGHRIRAYLDRFRP